MMNYNYYNERRQYTETEKDSDEYLMSNVDSAIAELVYDKTHLKTAYNYYNGKMDAEEFKYLEDNYGIGNPTGIVFVPLTRKHVDALVGQHLGNKFKPKVTCKDKKTLDAIQDMKKKELDRVELQDLKNQFQANLDHLIEKKNNPSAQAPVDAASEDNLKKKKENLSENFISEFEISAQFVLENLKVNRSFDLTEKRRLLMIDLLVAGECGYKVELVHEGQAPKVVILNPKDLFYERNRNSSYLKDSPRIVYRRWMNRDQILSRYGHVLENHREDVDKLFNNTEYMHYGTSGNVQYVSAPDLIGLQAGIGLSVDGTDAGNQGERYNVIPVYEVEWITTNKITENGQTIYRQDRYKGTRIGEEIYAEMGHDETAIRSNDNPYECHNSFNGMFYSDRNGKPYSLILATKNIQDKYNILHYQRDTMIANSGVKGSHVDVASIPAFLGNSPEERAMKSIGYRKQGVNFIDSSQENAGQANTIYAGFDETLSGQALQAIGYAIEQTEAVCSSITGVFKELLNGIEQKDAVANVEVGIKTSAVITKQYFHVMDSITTELLIDAINMCKVSYKKGTVGSVLLGSNRQKIFTINPKYFCFTDYDIHVGDSEEIMREIQEIKTISMELIKVGMADVDVVIDAITTESLTEMKEKIKEGIAKKSGDTDIQSQLQQQLLQLQEQLKQITQQAEQLQSENQQLKEADRQLAADKVNKDYEVKKTVADSNSSFNNEKIELEKKRVELEKLQLTDKNTNNDEVQNS